MKTEPFKLWLVFDLDNGDESKGHYAWWFETRQKARDHIKFQKKQKFAARLSQPICYEQSIPWDCPWLTKLGM